MESVLGTGQWQPTNSGDLGKKKFTILWDVAMKPSKWDKEDMTMVMVGTTLCSPHINTTIATKLA